MWIMGLMASKKILKQDCIALLKHWRQQNRFVEGCWDEPRIIRGFDGISRAIFFISQRHLKMYMGNSHLN